MREEEEGISGKTRSLVLNVVGEKETRRQDRGKYKEEINTSSLAD